MNFQLHASIWYYYIVCNDELSLEMNFQLHLMTRESGSHIILHFLNSILLNVSASESPGQFGYVQAEMLPTVV